MLVCLGYVFKTSGSSKGTRINLWSLTFSYKQKTNPRLIFLLKPNPVMSFRTGFGIKNKYPYQVQK